MVVNMLTLSLPGPLWLPLGDETAMHPGTLGQVAWTVLSMAVTLGAARAPALLDS
jgi:hypothetical protein